MDELRSRRVLVPIEVPDIDFRALEEAAHLIHNGRCDLFVLHVLPAIEHEEALGWGTVDGESREAYALRDLRQRLAGTRFECAQLSVAFGEASRAIIEQAKALRVDLIVMATHGRTGVSRLVSGSVTERVVRSAPCPVLALPPESSL